MSVYRTFDSMIDIIITKCSGCKEEIKNPTNISSCKEDWKCSRKYCPKCKDTHMRHGYCISDSYRQKYDFNCGFDISTDISPFIKK